MRLITSINWVLGVLALVAALVGPAIIETLGKGFYAVAEDTAKAIVRAETLYVSLNNSFHTFDATEESNRKAFKELNLTAPAEESGVPIFLYGADTDSEGNLIITARTNPALVRKEGYRPMVYRHQARSDGEGGGKWESLSGMKRGLGLF